MSTPRPAVGCAAGRVRGLLAGLALCLAAAGAEAAAPEEATMALCRSAAVAAADRHGVPREVMLAITQVETRTKRAGRSGPWPWTVNVAGKGEWFDSRAAALLHAQQALGRGEKSFDVGCFQLNYRWHGEHFASIDEMFEPGPSGDYAARFLKELYAETGDWMTASGNYHSRTPVHATRYRGLVARTIERMGGSAQLTAAASAAGAPASAARSPAAVAPLVVRVSTRGARGPLVVRTPRGTGRINGTQMILRAPGPELLASR
jgi:hypothetical protein